MLRNRTIIILGDILAILLVTVIGFAIHGELGASFVGRMSAAFFPLTVAWFLLAPFLGLFQPEIIANPRQLWRPVLAMIFAAPFAAILRGFLLDAPVPPVFAVVLASTSAFGMLAWRGVYFLLVRKKM